MNDALQAHRRLSIGERARVTTLRRCAVDASGAAAHDRRKHSSAEVGSRGLDDSDATPRLCNAMDSQNASEAVTSALWAVKH